MKLCLFSFKIIPWQPASSRITQDTLQTQQGAIFPCFSNNYTLLNDLTVDWI